MKKKVLIVDDDKFLLEALSFLLVSEGYKTAVNTGKTVLTELKRDRPDIILMDVLLSGRDGREISKTIKQKKSFQHIPIILLSAHPTIGKTYKKFLADAFLAKPFDNAQLITLIEKYTSSH
jgi:CheY-like chemotaxis protein